jgi:cytochrome c-type biogenesis protein CcmH
VGPLAAQIGKRAGTQRKCGEKLIRMGISPGLVCAILLVLSQPVFASSGPDHLTNSVLEARADALQKELRCVQCQSQSLDESDAPIAADLRRLIRTQIENGESDDQIKNYLVARYGDFILMKPPVEPDTYGLWFGPLIVLVIGGASAAVVIVRAHRRAQARETR